MIIIKLPPSTSIELASKLNVIRKSVFYISMRQIAGKLVNNMVRGIHLELWGFFYSGILLQLERRLCFQRLSVHENMEVCELFQVVIKIGTNLSILSLTSGELDEFRWWNFTEFFFATGACSNSFSSESLLFCECWTAFSFRSSSGKGTGSLVCL